MAARVESVVEREISCPLCHNIFQEPKKLPCDHVFCKACLEMLAAKRSATPAEISCPDCQSVAHLPNGVVEGLPTAFHVNRVFDAWQLISRHQQSALRTEPASPQATARVPAAAHTRDLDQSHRQREEWVIVGREDTLLSSSQMSEWQRMQAMREREQRAMAERPQNNPGDNSTAAKFSRFFSQLKTEWNVLVQGIKQLGRSQSREYRYQSW